MARRQSKKPLISLGSAIGIATAATLTSFGFNSLISRFAPASSSGDLQLLEGQPLGNFPNLHQAQGEMFINPTGLKAFHLGNVRKGQTLTPYGWLGVYDDANKDRLALTAWNGEIIWATPGYPGRGVPIYDVKYDFATNLIVVLYTNTWTGMFKPQSLDNKVWIDVLDAQTGQPIPNWKPLDLWDWAREARFKLEEAKLLDNVTPNLNDYQSWRALELYKLDLTAHPNKKDLLLIQLSPTLNQLVQRNSDNLPNFTQVVDVFERTFKFIVIDKNAEPIWLANQYPLNIKKWLAELGLNGSNWAFRDSVLNKMFSLDTNKLYLLSEPYSTPGHPNQFNTWFLHFFLGDETGAVFHVALNFAFDGVNNNKWAVFNKNQSKLEKLTESNGLGFSLKTNQYDWYKGARWLNRAFVTTNPANLRTNKNIFNPRLATWAYPYATVTASDPNSNITQNVVDDGSKGGGTSWTLFNVAQILTTPEGLVDRNGGPQKTRMFNFGEQIFQSWQKNPSAATIQPWPNGSHSSALHNFNRLVSVNPFDNSFLYSAMANIRGLNGAYSSQDQANKFKNLWLVNANGANQNFIPFIISNSADLGGSISPEMTTMADLEVRGLTWDIDAAINGRPKLYFNQTNVPNGETFSSPTGWSSAKIGMITGMDASGSLNASGILGSFSSGNRFLHHITSDDFGNLIHARANLEKWFNLTQYSLEHPANMLGRNEQLNKPNGQGGQVVVSGFGIPTKIPAGKTAQDLIDVVTHFRSGNFQNQLSVVNPDIVVGNDSGGSRDLLVATKYSPAKTTLAWYAKTFNQQITSAEQVVLTLNQKVKNASVQVFSKIGTDVKFTSLQERIGVQTKPSKGISYEIVTPATWFDMRQNPNNTPFGAVNNNQAENDRTPLRVLLQLVKPDQIPNWMTSFNAKVWQPAPFDGNKTSNESTFQDILNQYLRDLMAKITTTDLNQWGIGNLKIRATLGLNPAFAKNQEVYQINDTTQVIAAKNGSAYIFTDQHQITETLLYNQDATSYIQMAEHGYGPAVDKQIRNNWKAVPKTQKFLMDIPLNDVNGFKGLAYPIVRRGVSFANNDPIFRAKLKVKKIVLEPTSMASTEVAWFKNLLTTMNFKYGLFVILEGLANNQWTRIKAGGEDFYTDQELSNLWSDSAKSFQIPSDRNDITKLRIRLAYRHWNQIDNNPNDFILWEKQPINSYDPKLLSAEHPVTSTDIVIDTNWFSEAHAKLTTQQNRTLDQINEQDLLNYQEKVKTQFLATNGISGSQFWSKLEWEWEFNGKRFGNNAGLLAEINAKLSDHNDGNWNFGMWYLWTGKAQDKLGKQITARFKLKPAFATELQLVRPDGSLITSETDRQGFVASDIKSKFDVKPYFDQLVISGVNATPGSDPGSIVAISVPTVQAVAPWNQTFGSIQTILQKIGAKFQFQAQNKQGNWTSTWVDNVENINTFNPVNPRIKMRISVHNNWDNSLFCYGSDVINANQGFGVTGVEIKLNVPKLIAIPADFDNLLRQQVDQIKPFQGNTWKLNIDNIANFETKLTELLKEASDPGGLAGTHNTIQTHLQFTYQLGQSQWSDAQTLKQNLANITDVDQNSNQIKMRINLVQPPLGQKPEFILDSQLMNSFELLHANNTIVKIWLHGAKTEAALNQITASGSRVDLKYQWPPVLEPYRGQAQNHVSLQWSWSDNGKPPTHSSATWISNETTPLPSQLTGANTNANEIYVRLKHDNNDSIYLYGPEEEYQSNQSQNQWKIGIIDLSKMAFLLHVDKDWFSSTALTDQVIDLVNLKPDVFSKWKDAIWKQSNITSDLQKFVDIKFSVFNDAQPNVWIDATALIEKLITAQNNYPTTNGIISLWDGQSTNPAMIKIQAKFVKNSNTDPIVFVDQTNAQWQEQDLVGHVNSANVQTTIDLSNYGQILEGRPTTIELDQGGIGTIKRMIPPANDSGSHLLASKTFEEIMQVLSNYNIDFMFASNVNAAPPLKNWTSFADTHTYDPGIAKLNVALTNNSANLKIIWKTNTTPLLPSQDNKITPLTIKLAAPKAITIESADFNNLKDAFSGDTKHITVNTNLLGQTLELIKRRHIQASGNEDFGIAPLDIEVKIGDEHFTSYTTLQTVLAARQTDLNSREITIKFVLTPTINSGNQPNWILTGQSEQLVAGDGNSPLKIFINDQGIEQELSSGITFRGDNQRFTWVFPSGYSVDDKSGNVDYLSGKKGKGLRLEFTYNATLDPVNGPSGADPYEHWVRNYPTTFDSNRLPEPKVFVRFAVIDPTKYVAEKAPQTVNDKMTFALNLQTLLEVDADWLAIELSKTPKWITNLQFGDIETYETKVLENIKDWSPENKAKIAIQYQFNNQTYDKAGLFRALTTGWKDNFGFLQLWNGSGGQQIKATFIKVNPNGNYALKWANPNQQTGDVQTFNISTRIDLQSVVQWLKRTKFNFKPGLTSESISEIEFGNVSAGGGNPFDNQDWMTVSENLKNLNIITEYRELKNNADPNIASQWTTDPKLIQHFDKRGQFQIRFRLNNSGAGTNIQAVLDNDQIQGQTAATLANVQSKLESNILTINLQTPLQIELEQKDIDAFINHNGTISGNTKNLSISAAAEQGLINKILANNHNANPNANPQYPHANLRIEYAIGLNPLQNSWLEREAFMKALATSTSDQMSNQIQFRFTVINSNEQMPDFSVADAPFVLNRHTAISGVDSQTRIKYYVHTANWETAANSVQISGSNNSMVWNFTSFGNALNDLNSSVTIQTTPGGASLAVQFTTDPNANYNGTTGSDLSSSWISAKPTMIKPNVQKLSIRIVPINGGIIYEAKENHTASVHEIDLRNLKREIQVNKAWLHTDLTVANSSKEINDLQESDIATFERQVFSNLQDQNLIPHLTIRYSMGTSTNLTKTQLLAKIQSELNHFNNSNMGVIQLFNGIAGQAITANFDLAVSGGQYTLIDQNNQAIQPEDTSQTIITKSIVTRINFTSYIKQLQELKIAVKLGATPNTLISVDWPDHRGSASQQFGGQSLSQILAVFASAGITMEVRSLQNGIIPDPNVNWVSWDQLKTYDANSNKIEIRFKLDPSKGSNVRMDLLGVNSKNLDGTASPQKLASTPIQLTLAAPLKFRIDQQWIADFKIQKPISGNTKHLKIDKNAEQKLLDKIVSENAKTNTDFNLARNKIKIQYTLGSGATGASWQTSDQLVQVLLQAHDDQSTNQFSIRFIIDDPSQNPNEQKFQVDSHISSVVDEAIGSKSAQVKIYINEKNRENDANNISIRGTNNKFTWNYPSHLQPQVDGTFANVPGLRMQWSTRDGITNAPYNSSDQNNDPSKGWINRQPDSIDAAKRILYIQLVADDGYEYGPQYKLTTPSDPSNNWRVHQVDVSRIKSEINVNLSALNQIVWSGRTDALNLSAISASENLAKQQANNDPLLQNKLKIQYKIEWQGHEIVAWNDSELAIQYLHNWAKDNANFASGLIKFNGWGATTFANVSARFVSTDSNFVVVDSSLSNQAMTGRPIDAKDVQTNVDLSYYTKILGNSFVKLQPGSTQDKLVIESLPSMDGGDPFLKNRTWHEIEILMNSIGLKAEFAAPTGVNSSSLNWVSLGQITTLNQNNDLFMRWRLDATKIADSTGLQNFARSLIVTTNGIQDLTTTEHATSPIRLKVNLPVKIVTDSSVLKSKFTSQFSGNTWQLQIGQTVTLVQQTIDEVLTTNNTSKDAPLKILFSLDNRVISGSQIWYEITDLVDVLQRSSANWTSNRFLAKFAIVNPQGLEQKYEITDDTSVEVLAENNTDKAAVKKYIHEGDFWNNIVQDLKPTGTNQAYQFVNYAQWLAKLPQGLTLQLSKDSSDLTSSSWQDFNEQNLPKPLNPDKDLWARLKISGDFVFASASQTDSRFTEAKKIDTSQLKAIIEVDKNWLNLIRFTGKLNKILIDETDFKQTILGQNILPTTSPDLLQIQYRINGQEWVNQKQFEAILVRQDGAKDANRWILMHDDIEIRFWLDPTQPHAEEYLLSISGSVVPDLNDPINLAKPLTNPPSQTNVTGIINANKLTDFVKSNFYITGTNNAPKFKVVKDQVINMLIAQYASQPTLFDIEYTTQFNQSTNQFDWTAAKSLIANNRSGFIDEMGLINQGATIGNDRRFAIRLVAKDANFEVQKDGQSQSDGYTIDLTDNVKITIEITNPFTSQGKTLALWTRDTQGKAKWFQGQGQFRIVVGDQNYSPESNYQAAQTFLNQHLAAELRDKVEFVYRIFDEQPSAEQIQLAQDKTSINDYDAAGPASWRSFDFAPGAAQEYWSQNLNLHVGQFVMVALRVKREYAFGDKSYQMKADDNSVLIPVLPNQPAGPNQLPGRIAGYKVDPHRANVVPDRVVLSSQSTTVSGFLDGWTQLEQLGLNVDPDNHAAGIDLELNFYNSFHLDSNNNVLVSASHSKLVKRVSQGMTQGKPYVDLQGREITDRDGNKVYLLTDPATKRLAAPAASVQPTQVVPLVAQFGGQFYVPSLVGADPNLLSLFRNQKLDLTYKAKIGAGTSQLPDYELTQEFKVDLQPIISPQIKFAIENPQNIVYAWENRDAFADGKVEFEPVNDESKPTEGFARVKTIAQLQRLRRTDSSDVGTITGATGAEAAQNMQAKLKEDFGDQLQFSYTHIRKSGSQSTISNSANFYDLTNLHNGDRIIVNLEATAPDQLYLDAPEPLAILVSGLAVDAPDQSLLQHLRVEQGGSTNGQGSFRLLLHEPGSAYQDPNTILRGWKFLIRVWDGTSQKVKIDWTDDQATLTNLHNGDRVEWKLVDRDKNPVKEAYYNTVALRHEIANSAGAIKFNFGQVDYADGPNSQRVVRSGIGDYPPKDQDEQFPTVSGFTIAGLQDQNQRFDLQPWAFAKVIETLGPFYRGQNGNGALNFNHQYFEGLWYVNLAGELYQTPRYPAPDLQTPQEIPLSQFLTHTTFFTQDPTLNPAQVGFKFMANATNTGNYLSNGDQVWAQFNSTVGSDEANWEPSQKSQAFQHRTYGDHPASYVYQLPDVSGLDQISDPMHPLWWLLIALAGLATLGTAWLVIWHKRHRKLKVKEF